VSLAFSFSFSFSFSFFAVDILMYAPQKPSFDGAIPFLWLMAVGTVACASVWTVAVVGEEVHRTHKLTTFHQFSENLASLLLLTRSISMVVATL
jgi:hypothetical protein